MQQIAPSGVAKGTAVQPGVERTETQLMGTGTTPVNDEDPSDAEDGLGQAICDQEEGKLEEYEDDNQCLPSEPLGDSGDEDKPTEEEADIIFQATRLAMEQEKLDDNNNSEDSDEETESDNYSDTNDSNYVPNKIQGIHKHHRPLKMKKSDLVEHKQTKTNSKSEMQNCRSKKGTYQFCPPPHQLSILCLVTKHFCQHPLLPERHGQPQSSVQIHRDAVYEAYLHCKNNQLQEVWAYLWTNWYTPDKWRLWARSAYPYAIPRKRTTMIVEAMW